METRKLSVWEEFSEFIFATLLLLVWAVYLYKTAVVFPWFSLLALPLGLSLMIFCWKNKKHDWFSFQTGLLLNTFLLLVFFMMIIE